VASSSVLQVPTAEDLAGTRRPRIASTADSRPSAGSSGSRGSRGSAPSGPSGPSSNDALDLKHDPGYDLEPAGPSHLDAAFFLSDEAAAPPKQEESGAANEPVAGQVLGGYRLLKVLGRGGMGIIFTAKKEPGPEPAQGGAPDETIVALKVLLGGQDVGADRRRQRFRCEFEALRRLEHECIVKVFDFGRDGPFDWYTMDYVEGKDFEKLLLENSLEAAERLSIYADIVEAIAHAHERNVVHRDLKPQNVLVDGKGRGRVLDFGLAKILDQGVGMTRTGSSLGTPFYMAPEQLKSAKHIDARADVFALGVILFEVTTGSRPFNGETAAEVGQRILNDDPPKPSKLKKTIHPDLDAICLRALEKEADRRYANAGELLADLRRHRKGLGVGGATGVQGAVGDARRWATRNRAGLIGGLAASAIFIPVMIVLLVRSGDKNGGEQPQTKDPVTATSSATPPPKPTETKPPPKATETKPPPKVTETKPPPTPTEPKPPVTEPRPPVTEPRPPVTEPKPPVTELPTPEPAPARTDEELARLACAPPTEPGPAGADQVRDANKDPAVLRALVHTLEAELLPAMATGDLARASAVVRRLRGDRELSLAGLADEVDHDVATLVELRELVVLRLKADPKGWRSEVWSPTGTINHKGTFSTDALGEDGLVRLKDGATTTAVDPLGLELPVLRALCLATGPKADLVNGPVRYALAVLGVWRGLTERDLDKDLTAAGGSQAVQSRRQLARWLEEVRPAVARGLEDEAAATWRELTTGRKSDDKLVAGALAFVETFGRTAAWKDRRKEVLDLLAQRQPLHELLADGVARKGKPAASWDPLRDDRLADVEVGPCKVSNDLGYRAEAGDSGLALRNGRVWVDLCDLVPTEATLDLAAQPGIVSAHLGALEQEFDPATAWLVKDGAKKLKEDAKRRSPLGAGKTFAFERGGTDAAPLRVVKLGPSERLELPWDTGVRNNATTLLGAFAEGDLRVKGLTLAWREEDNPRRAEKLVRRLVERRALAALVEGEKHGHVVARLDPARPVGLVLHDGVTVEPDGLALAGDASLVTVAWSDVGVMRLQVGLDDGPGGVRVSLRAAGNSGGSAALAWTIPARLEPDLAKARKVELRYDLRFKVATLVVDGIPLRAQLPSATNAAAQLPTRAVVVVETVGRTRARIPSFEVVQVAPRAR
jgi:serine/threonine protein kinase